MDLDGDGHVDILSGSYSRMSQPMAGLFQVLWGQPGSKFKVAAELLGTDKEPLIIPAKQETITETICTRPMAVDWDGDQDLDLVVGNFSGTFYVFLGEGKGRFAPQPQQIMTNSGPLRIDGAHSDPFPVDWDGDGDLDLVSGSSRGGVQWAMNESGTGQIPKFSKFHDLIPPGRQVPYGEQIDERDLTGPTGSTRVWVDDVNEDGKLDLLVGDSITLVAIANGLSKQEFDERRSKWQKELEQVSREYSAAEGDGDKIRAASEKIQKLYDQRKEFMTEDQTGFVWLYVQK